MANGMDLVTQHGQRFVDGLIAKLVNAGASPLDRLYDESIRQPASTFPLGCGGMSPAPVCRVYTLTNLFSDSELLKTKTVQVTVEPAGNIDFNDASTEACNRQADLYLCKDQCIQKVEYECPPGTDGVGSNGIDVDRPPVNIAFDAFRFVCLRLRRLVLTTIAPRPFYEFCASKKRKH